MCVVALAHELHPSHRLIVLANRDERYARPSAPATYWYDDPAVFAGRDLLRGGTWLGISRRGRFALVTNVRAPEAEPSPDAPDAPDEATTSRGQLVRRWLQDGEAARPFVAGIRAARVEGFTLIFGEAGADLWCYQSQGDALSALGPGLYGLSNDRLDTPWPKVQRAKEGLGRLLARGPFDPEAAFEVLADGREAPSDALPDTGLEPEIERALSPIFVATPTYGTRASTVFTVGRDGVLWCEERRFGPERQALGHSTVAMTLGRG